MAPKNAAKGNGKAAAGKGKQTAAAGKAIAKAIPQAPAGAYFKSRMTSSGNPVQDTWWTATTW